ncbi:MAG: 2-oxoglutarate oxidoreductase, partial [Desulfoplanes sp.]|nr:2-oxoglutarate oxidoreductase [Desulfoplanes sp.]
MEEELVYTRPDVVADRATHYCPGCHHGIIHKLVAEALIDLGVVEKTICIGSIGCSVFIYNYLNLDTVEAPH